MKVKIKRGDVWKNHYESISGGTQRMHIANISGGEVDYSFYFGKTNDSMFNYKGKIESVEGFLEHMDYTLEYRKRNIGIIKNY